MKEVSAAQLGDLGISLIEFPALFMEPIFIGERPSAGRNPYMSNGTATLVRLGGRYLAITCHHVYAHYRDSLRTHLWVFQIGDLEIDPKSQLLSESEEMDLVVFEIEPAQIDHEILTAPWRRLGKLRATRFFEPASWPPPPARVGDVVSFAGYPGSWRERKGSAVLGMYMFGHGAARVDSAGPAHFYTRLEIDQCEGITLKEKTMENIGGVSGGPVFAWKRDQIQAQLLGFITEYSHGWDLLHVRSSGLIAEQGTVLSEWDVPPPNTASQPGGEDIAS